MTGVGQGIELAKVNGSKMRPECLARLRFSRRPFAFAGFSASSTSSLLRSAIGRIQKVAGRDKAVVDLPRFINLMQSAQIAGIVARSALLQPAPTLFVPPTVYGRTGS